MSKLDIIGPIMERYGIPPWVSPFIYDYVKKDPINAVKKGLSFIDTKRKKGEVTKKGVVLPNNYVFDIGSISEILSAFFYLEDRVSRIIDEWLSVAPGHDYLEYGEHFQKISENDKRHARAIKNLTEGLGIKIGEPKQELKEVFDSLEAVNSWPERLIALEVILKRSYATFGMVFYKVFYPASPEFMRSFAKVFRSEEIESWESKEVERLLASNEIGKERVLELSEELLVKAYDSMHAYMPIAKKEKIAEEVELIIAVALAHPLQFLNEHGIEVNVKKKVDEILSASKRK
ncbi:MAG: hypothetical protein ACP5NE_03085 [Candidatus Micrarchaeia archaeon]